MKNTKIIKIGGSVLASPADYKKVAMKVAGNANGPVCLVTSAMKGKTSDLAKTFLAAVPEPDFWNYERYIGMGEILSAILLESAFLQIGKTAIAVLPWMKEWPLFVSLKNRVGASAQKTNERRDFTLLRKSMDKTKRHFKPLVRDNEVVIVPGFIAKDGRGRLVTLGRGGSDISAFLFAELLVAEELIFLKDVDGIRNVDPSLHKGSQRIKAMNSDELGMVASSGAQVLNPISLKHRRKLKKVKVVSVDAGSFESGTQVSFKKEIAVQLSPVAFSVLTFIGSKLPETPGIIYEISRTLSREGISIYSLTLSDNLVAIYVEDGKAEISYRLLSPLLDKVKHLKVLNLKRNIGKVVVRSLKFINEPGVIREIVVPVSKSGINIWEVLTVHTDIMVFVEKKDARKTYQVIRGIFGE
jgi:aspartate kinase